MFGVCGFASLLGVCVGLPMADFLVLRFLWCLVWVLLVGCCFRRSCGWLYLVVFGFPRLGCMVCFLGGLGFW